MKKESAKMKILRVFFFKGGWEVRKWWPKSCCGEIYFCTNDVRKVLDLFKAIFCGFYHGKPPFFTTIGRIFLGSLLPSMEEFQIQDDWTTSKAFNDLKSISPW